VMSAAGTLSTPGASPAHVRRPCLSNTCSITISQEWRPRRIAQITPNVNTSSLAHIRGSGSHVKDPELALFPRRTQPKVRKE
jgi:hypothetical protein